MTRTSSYIRIPAAFCVSLPDFHAWIFSPIYSLMYLFLHCTSLNLFYLRSQEMVFGHRRKLRTCLLGSADAELVWPVQVVLCIVLGRNSFNLGVLSVVDINMRNGGA